MTATGPVSESHADAVASALEPYQWRRLRPELMGRMVLAASDRQQVRGLLLGVPGVAVGDWGPLEPADRADPRLTRLVEFLTAHRWTELSLGALCAQLLTLLDDRAG